MPSRTFPKFPLDQFGQPILPRLAGADDAAAAAAADEAAAKEAADKAAADAAAAAEAAKKEAQLGEGGKAALEAERKARRDAEKRAKDAEAKVKAAEDATATDLEKATKRADEAEARINAATGKVRTANLVSALADQGLTGAKGKAAARLLDGVEFDDATDEPTNLDAALTAAKALYGEDIFKGAKPKAPVINGDAANKDREGPNLTADELAAAKASGMTAEEYANYKSPQPTLPAKKE